MTDVALGGLALLVAFMCLALAGAVRTLAELRRRVGALEAEALLRDPAPGLPVGAPAPAFGGITPDGRRFHSTRLAGRRHLVALTEPGCEACDGLVPPLLAAAARDELPPVVAVVSNGHPAAEWTPPRGSGDRADVVLDPDGAVANAFDSGYSPHVFVVDEGGSVAAQGPAGNVADVRALVSEAEGIRIVQTEGTG